MMNEPKEFVAGDTVEFTIAESDYPASTWVGHCKVVGQQGALDSVTSTADGDSHVFTLSASATAGLKAGVYTIAIWFISGSKRHSRATCTVTVYANLAVETGAVDTRHHAVKMLALIESALETLARNPKTTVSINNRSYSSENLGELHRMRNLYKNEVSDLEMSERLKNGNGGRKRLFMRLV